MDEDLFNMEVRKFLKKVGITSQREIEKAVRQALRAGTLKNSAKLKARMVLTIEQLELSHEIGGTLKLS
jgi:predicted nucleotide-binding protein (sugar kinase/HSP70/actin superfamily)